MRDLGRLSSIESIKPEFKDIGDRNNPEKATEKLDEPLKDQFTIDGKDSLERVESKTEPELLQELSDTLEQISLDEREIYNDANLEMGVVGERPALKSTEIDLSKTDDFGRTNEMRMKEGLPPLVDGQPIELHHIGQKSDGPLAELTPEQHRGKGNYSVLHEVGKESEIDRTAFNKERQEYWKERVNDFE